MSDPTDQTITPPEGGPNIQELRDAADRGAKAARENLFLRAKVDLDSPLGAMFMRGYDGELTVDAVKAAWAEIPQVPAPVANAAEQQQATDAAAQAAAEEQARAQQDAARRSIGTAPTEPPAEKVANPLEAGYQGFHQNLADGMSRDRAAKPVFEQIIGAAANGDERFIFNGWTSEELEEGRTSRA